MRTLTLDSPVRRRPWFALPLPPAWPQEETRPPPAPDDEVEPLPRAVPQAEQTGYYENCFGVPRVPSGPVGCHAESAGPAGPPAPLRCTGIPIPQEIDAGRAIVLHKKPVAYQG